MILINVTDHLEQQAVCRVFLVDRRAVIATDDKAATTDQLQAGTNLDPALGILAAMATEAVLSQQGANFLGEKGNLLWRKVRVLNCLGLLTPGIGGEKHQGTKAKNRAGE